MEVSKGFAVSHPSEARMGTQFVWRVKIARSRSRSLGFAEKRCARDDTSVGRGGLRHATHPLGGCPAHALIRDEKQKQVPRLR